MTSTGTIDLTPAEPSPAKAPVQRGWRRFWDARQCSPWYLGIVSILVVLSISSDLVSEVTELESAERQDRYVLILGLLAAAFLLQWVSTTVAFTALLPVYFLARTGGETLPILLYGTLIVSAVVATANALFSVIASVLALGWAVLFPSLLHQPASTIWFSVIISVLGIGVGLFVRFAWMRREADALKIQEARRQALEAALRERRVLARDLHDIVAHNLTIISMQARTAQFVGTDEAARQALDVVGSSAKDALVDLRRMLALMREEGVVGDQAQPGHSGSESSTSVDIDLGVSRVSHELMELGFTVRADVRLEGRAVPLGTQSTLYRVLQEATSNIAKHGDRSEPVQISVGLEGADAVLRVSNAIERRPQSRKGRGGQAWNSSGVGLNSMRERVSAFGGTFSVGPEGDQWRLVAAVPAGDPEDM
ncbi:two-component system sensor kinase [Micrococcus lylae]|uniref:histidine kinase n=1 Tax=Micrococcus lylae TaxID=1273 RepID=A0A1R4JHQ5_9MICC|nr:two-component system sensor kinase [Micrococcus lylae]